MSKIVEVWHGTSADAYKVMIKEHAMNMRTSENKIILDVSNTWKQSDPSKIYFWRGGREKLEDAYRSAVHASAVHGTKEDYCIVLHGYIPEEKISKDTSRGAFEDGVQMDRKEFDVTDFDIIAMKYSYKDRAKYLYNQFNNCGGTVWSSSNKLIRRDKDELLKDMIKLCEENDYEEHWWNELYYKDGKDEFIIPDISLIHTADVDKRSKESIIGQMYRNLKVMNSYENKDTTDYESIDVNAIYPDISLDAIDSPTPDVVSINPNELYIDKLRKTIEDRDKHIMELKRQIKSMEECKSPCGVSDDCLHCGSNETSNNNNNQKVYIVTTLIDYFGEVENSDKAFSDYESAREYFNKRIKADMDEWIENDWQFSVEYSDPNSYYAYDQDKENTTQIDLKELNIENNNKEGE